MGRAAEHRKVITTLVSAFLLFFTQLKPLHHLIVQHSVVEHQDLCSIHKAQEHCAVCDYHLSAAITAATAPVDFTPCLYVLLETARLSYYFPTVISANHKRGPPVQQ
jgi:hypothetical protein